MGNLADRFPNLFMAAKVVALLVIVLLALVAMSLVLLIAVAAYIILTGGDATAAAETALSALMENAIVSSLYMIVQNIVLVLIAVLFVVVVDGRRQALKALGLGWEKRSLADFARGIALNFLFLLAVLLIIVLTGVASYEGTGLSAYGLSSVAVSLVAMAIGTLCVGIGEETVFRGYLQQNLTGRYGIAAGLLVTSAIFALFHSVTPFAKLGPLYLLGVFTLSMLLGYLLWITKSLYASIGFHFFQDFLALQVFNFTGEQTLGASPLFIFTKPEEIVVFGIFLGSWDDLIGIIICAIIICSLYVYRVKKQRSSNKDKMEGVHPPQE
jgi:membrane protease YdiL (CAAX protease family)